MNAPNFSRMMQIIDEVFDTRNDPGQLQVNAAQRRKLQNLHPDTMMELADENGPVIWLLLIPTTEILMDLFLKGKLNEKQLLEDTKATDDLTCLYLCSATTLPEYRGKGETKKLCLQAIREMSKSFNLKFLFAWPFTLEGERLAQAISAESQIPLKLRTH